MSDCPPGNPRILPPPAVDVHDLGPCSLAERLAATVNRVRQTQTNLGLRLYRVFSVRRHWSGGVAGRGDVREVRTLELLPRPKVEFRTRRVVTPAGYQERGVVVLSEINPQLTEDQVVDLFGTALGPGDEAFLEIYLDARDGATKRRRCVVIEPPQRTQFAWRVVLSEQDTARDRGGNTSYPGQRR